MANGFTRLPYAIWICYTLCPALVGMVTCARDHQLAVFDSAQAQDPIRKVTNLSTAALDDNHFEAVVMVEVHMQRRKYLTAQLMLRLD